MKCFFYNELTDEYVESSNPIVATPEQAIAIFKALPVSGNSHIGLIDPNNNVMQAYKISEQKVMVDIPIPSMKGSWQKSLSENVFIKTINTAPFEFLQGQPRNGFSWIKWT